MAPQVTEVVATSVMVIHMCGALLQLVTIVAILRQLPGRANAAFRLIVSMATSDLIFCLAGSFGSFESIVGRFHFEHAPVLIAALEHTTYTVFTVCYVRFVGW